MTSRKSVLQEPPADVTCRQIRRDASHLRFYNLRLGPCESFHVLRVFSLGILPPPSRRERFDSEKIATRHPWEAIGFGAWGMAGAGVEGSGEWTPGKHSYARRLQKMAEGT